MAALTAVTSSCSNKALCDHGLRSCSTRPVSAFRFSDRLEFSNFRFLQQMVQNKVISPVLLAVSSQPHQEDYLETEEPQAQQTEQTKVVRMQFQLQKDYMLGEQMFFVRKDPKIGAWDLRNALPMTWSEEHQGWFAELDVPGSIQYKYILKSACGDATWQPGPRRIVMTWPSFNRITICEEWEKFQTKRGHFTGETTNDTTDTTSVGELSLKPRFEFPTLQNKGISLVHAVPPEPQEDYFAFERPQPQQAGEETKYVRIQFQLQKDYMLGEQLFVVRDYPAWGLKSALPMTWSEGHQGWFAEVDVPAGIIHVYTFVLKSTCGDAIWQPKLFRIVATSKTFKRITICEEWGDAKLNEKFLSRHHIV